MPAPNRLIRHPAELAALSVFPLMHPRPRGTIKIESEALADDRRSAWEKRLNHAYRACGCGEASLGTVTGLIFAGVWIGLRISDGSGFDTGSGLILAGSAIVGTAFGKVVGLLRAEARLRHLVKEIKAEWKAEPRPVVDIGCG